jgi:hypothetical protein
MKFWSWLNLFGKGDCFVTSQVSARETAAADFDCGMRTCGNEDPRLTQNRGLDIIEGCRCSLPGNNLMEKT